MDKGNSINQQLLREIGATIRNYERKRIAERSNEHGTDLHTERGLSDPEHQADRTGSETHREVRTDAQTVSERTSSDSLESADSDRTAVSAYPEYYKAKSEYRELLTYQANLIGLFGIENVRAEQQKER